MKKRSRKKLRGILSLLLICLIFIGTLLFYSAKELHFARIANRAQATITDSYLDRYNRTFNFSYTFTDDKDVTHVVGNSYKYRRQPPEFYDEKVITIAYDKDDSNRIIILGDWIWLRVLRFLL